VRFGAGQARSRRFERQIPNLTAFVPVAAAVSADDRRARASPPIVSLARL